MCIPCTIALQKGTKRPYLVPYSRTQVFDVFLRAVLTHVLSTNLTPGRPPFAKQLEDLIPCETSVFSASFHKTINHLAFSLNQSTTILHFRNLTFRHTPTTFSIAIRNSMGSFDCQMGQIVNLELIAREGTFKQVYSLQGTSAKSALTMADNNYLFLVLKILFVQYCLVHHLTCSNYRTRLY